MTKYLLLAVNLALGMFLMPFTVHHLGTTEYGLWMLVASMTAYFQLLDLGYGNGLVRHVSAADALGDIGLVNQVLSTFTVVYAGLGLVAAAGIGALVIWIVPRFPHLLPEQIGMARWVLILIGLRVAVGFPMTVFGAATTARQRFALNNLVATASSLLNGAVTLGLLVLGFRVRGIVAGSTAVALLSYGAYAWTAKTAFPELRLRLSSFNGSLVRDVTAFSMYLFIIDLAVQIGFNLDDVVIGAALGTSAVAVYVVAQRLADYQQRVSNQFNGLIFPVVVRYGAVDQPDARDRLRRMLVDGTRFALTLVVGVTVCLMGFADALIARWMGPGFEGAVLPLQVLAVMGVVIVGQGPLGNILLGTGRHRLVAFTSLSEAVANLILSLALVRHYGALGVAIGSAVPLIVANVFVLAPAACRQVGIGMRDFLRQVATAPLACGALAAAATGLLRARWAPASLTVIFIEGALVGGTYLVAVWTLGFDKAIRARYWSYGRRLLPAALTEQSV